MEVKRIDIKEFRELGCLHELNRQFLHPLGLALEVVINDETGEESLGGIWDSRDDPEGIRYTELDTEKVKRFGKFRNSRIGKRVLALGYVIQPAQGELASQEWIAGFVQGGLDRLAIEVERGDWRE